MERHQHFQATDTSVSCHLRRCIAQLQLEVSAIDRRLSEVSDILETLECSERRDQFPSSRISPLGGRKRRTPCAEGGRVRAAGISKPSPQIEALSPLGYWLAGLASL